MQGKPAFICKFLIVIVPLPARLVLAVEERVRADGLGKAGEVEQQTRHEAVSGADINEPLALQIRADHAEDVDHLMALQGHARALPVG